MTFIKGERRIGWGKLREKILGYSLTGKWVPNLQRLDDKSRMSRDVHVRICESVRVKSPRATRPLWVAFDGGLRNVTRQKLRLRGIDAPEIHTRAGKRAYEFLKATLADAPFLILYSYKNDKFDRFETDLFIPRKEKATPEPASLGLSDLIFINNLLLEHGFAVRIRE